MQRKVVFLDRDGVINLYPGDGEYVLRREELKIFPFVKPSLKKLKEANFSIYIISNQACVSKGLITSGELLELTSYMLSLIEDGEALIEGVYYCIHTDKEACPFRKPSAGLIREVFKNIHIDGDNLENQPIFFIGDSLRDIKTARLAKIKSILVLSGREKIENRNSWELQPDYIFSNLEEAVNFIVKNFPD